MSKRDAAAAINSIAQQARPIGIGQSEFFRTQLSAASKRVKMTLPSIFESYAVPRVSGMIKIKIRFVARKPNRDVKRRGSLQSEAGYIVCDFGEFVCVLVAA